MTQKKQLKKNLSPVLNEVYFNSRVCHKYHYKEISLFTKKVGKLAIQLQLSMSTITVKRTHPTLCPTATVNDPKSVQFPYNVPAK